MTFAFPLLAALGAVLALGPIVVHLLNRRRRRVVAWAAMDFLLASDRRNRTRVRLSEWLLLLCRVLAVAVAGLLAAGPRAAQLLEGWFGPAPATHFVLLDDSASMRQTGPDGEAFRAATDAIARLAEFARRHGDRVVVVRFTDRLTGGEPESLVGDDATPGDPAAWSAGYASAGPSDAIARIVSRIDEPGATGRRFAYLFSDFAGPSQPTNDTWTAPLEQLSARTDGLVLATVGEPATTNLGVESLTLGPGPRAAGIEEQLVVEIANHGDSEIESTPVTIQRAGVTIATVEVGRIGPRSRRRVETPIRLPGVGVHAVTARLPSDPLSADNERHLAVEAVAARPVLLIADNPRGAESLVFSAALAPIGSARSGWAPRAATRLTDHALDEAAAVLLLDPPRLSASDSQRLTEYVASGGGVLAVAGPNADAEWFDRFWRSVGGSATLGPATSPPPVAPGASVLQPVGHPALRALGGEQNPFLALVRVMAFRRGEPSDAPTLRPVSERSAGGATPREALLRLINGADLMIESRHGAGRAVAFFTTAASGEPGAAPWTNLATLPVFPVLANDLTAWLAQGRLRPQVESIGEPRAASASPRDALLRLQPDGDAAPASGLGRVAPLAPAEPGVFRRVVNGTESAPFAAVVDPRESDLRAPTVTQLRDRFDGVARVAPAGELFREEQQPESRTLLFAVAAALLGLLAAERLLAYRCSYVASAAPPPAVGGRA